MITKCKKHIEGDRVAGVSLHSLCKYADDTYLIIPADNVDSRIDELSNVEAWSQTNNLTLNRSKSMEIVFTAKRRKRDIHLPSPIPNTSIKILGVIISNCLCVILSVCPVCLSAR